MFIYALASYEIRNALQKSTEPHSFSFVWHSALKQTNKTLYFLLS